MNRSEKEYEGYADHPRYGKHPRFTGANPQDDYSNSVNLHWHTRPSCLIEHTAIMADVTRQVDAMFGITHYFDVKRRCDDCGRMFIFFAEEQKHWYEVLQFSINADCVRCVECRKEKQNIASRRRQYELLIKSDDLSEIDTLSLVDCCLSLIESSEFGHRSLQTARRLLNSIPVDSVVRQHSTYHKLAARSDKLLTNFGQQGDEPESRIAD